MPTALQDMPAWRRKLIEAGIALKDIAALTGKSEQTVWAYSQGARKAPEDWQAAVERIADEAITARTGAAQA